MSKECISGLTDSICFFFNDTATTEIYTLSLHDALPILRAPRSAGGTTTQSPAYRGCQHAPTYQERSYFDTAPATRTGCRVVGDRKSTRLNSSHANISYAVFCLKKKNTHQHSHHHTISYT